LPISKCSKKLLAIVFPFVSTLVKSSIIINPPLTILVFKNKKASFEDSYISQSIKAKEKLVFCNLGLLKASLKNPS